MTSTPLDRSNHQKTSDRFQQSVELNLTGSLFDCQKSQCLNPECLKLNQGKPEFCHDCQQKLLLQKRYRAIKYLNQGGFARTFIAVDEIRFDHLCLIKQFDQQIDSNARQLLATEAAILKYLGDYPKIPNLLAFFVEDNQSYLITEFIVGKNLLEVQQQTGCLNQLQVIHLLSKLLPILEFIHQRQVIHRDIKPSNIIYEQDNSISLIDFGSSILLKTEFQQRSPILGTPGYAPPEQLQGQVYPASDLYSLGVTVWQLLTGIMPPETGILPEWLWQANVTLDRDFTKIIAKLLQPDWRDRYQSATKVLTALSAVVPSTTIASFPENNYQQLEDFLAQQNYLLAEQATWQLILQLAQRETQACLTLETIDNLSIAELKTIDFLWRKYSRDRFGFSIQKSIYQNLAAEIDNNFLLWKEFTRQVGWYQQKQWLNYTQLNFTATAPIGHLPVCCIDVFNRVGINRDVCNWWRTGFLALIKKIDF